MSAHDATAPLDPRPWSHPSLPARERAERLVAAMTLDEKIAMVHGDGMVWAAGYAGHVPGNERLGIPGLFLADGPTGVGNGSAGVTAFPVTAALAASWDPDLAERFGVAYAEEQAGKGNDVALTPTLNILRIPTWGRDFETFSEDPLLTAVLGSAEIRGIQSRGVIATPKHLVANNQEMQRREIDVRVSERALREIYYPAFETAVEAGALSVMCSYNRVNGPYASESRTTMTDVLKGDWGFEGFVMSDWAATHSTAPAANAGLDMEMPAGANPWTPEYFGDELRRAVAAGEVTEARLDDMVRRIVLAMFRAGVFDRPRSGDRSAEVTTAGHRDLAREIAEQGAVLLRNDGVLPLRDVGSIAVIGDAAGGGLRVSGGGSAAMIPSRLVTPIDGIRRRAGDGVAVTYARGTMGLEPLPVVPASAFRTPDGAEGLTATYFAARDLTGHAVATRTDRRVDPAGIPADIEGAVAVRWNGTIVPPRTGTFRFSLTGGGTAQVRIGGRPVVTLTPWHEIVVSGVTTLEQGVAVPIEVDWVPGGGEDWIERGLELGWEPDQDRLLAEAVAAAREAEVAVVVVGDAASEATDRSTLALPGDQDALVEAIAGANPRTVVVLDTSGPVLMPWLDRVAAVLAAWYPGQEAGDALAHLLFGDVAPSAKLPMTFPATDRQGPATTPRRYPGDGVAVWYEEELQVGYRWYDASGEVPLFPFGFGLSYTRFSYDALEVEALGGWTAGMEAGHSPGDAVPALAIAFDVSNAGPRAGSEVAQVYAALPASAGEPPKRLVAFAKVELERGETRRITIPVDRRWLSVWDVEAHGRLLAPGRYRVMVGGSSADLPLEAAIDLA